MMEDSVRLDGVGVNSSEDGIDDGTDNNGLSVDGHVEGDRMSSADRDSVSGSELETELLITEQGKGTSAGSILYSLPGMVGTTEGTMLCASSSSMLLQSSAVT